MSQSSRRAALAAGVVLLASLHPCPAAADGAFPDSQRILLPTDRPSDVLVSTNFGLLVSSDGAATFRLVCEAEIASYASLYQLGAAPDDLLFAIAPSALVRSADHGCGWQPLTNGLNGLHAVDAFPDPTDSQRLLVIATTHDDGGDSESVLVESRDGGQQFGAPLYVSPPGGLLTGVESATSAPQTIYLALASPDPHNPSQTQPTLLRSDDGATFQSFAAGAAVGSQTLRILAVDPADPKTVYLRVSGDAVDSFAISQDGGATIAIRLALNARMTAFLQRTNGTFLIGTSDGRLLTSTDATNFSTIGEPIYTRALAERGSTLYLAADNLADGFALGTSQDGGLHVEPRMRFQDLCGPLDCGNLASACAVPFTILSAEVKGAPIAACGPMTDGATRPIDASTLPVAPASGCGCRVAATQRNSVALPALGILCLCGLGRWRIRRRGDRRSRQRLATAPRR